MAIHHANPGEIVDVQPLGERLAESKTQTLFKTDSMETLRLVLPAGKKIAEHKAPGEIIVHCLEGHVKFTAAGSTHELTAGKLLYLSSSEPHAVEAVSDASVLVTIVRNKVVST